MQQPRVRGVRNRINLKRGYVNVAHLDLGHPKEAYDERARGLAPDRLAVVQGELNATYRE